MTLRGLRSDRPCVILWLYLLTSHATCRAVPEVPHKITGPCVYGYLITDEHRDHFRSLYSDTEEFQISNPASLVSYASVIVSEIHIADTSAVYDHQGDKAVCLALIDYKDRCRLIDQRWSVEFITALETALGIKGKPDWYPCRFKRIGVRRTWACECLIHLIDHF